jgi:protein PhnA
MAACNHKKSPVKLVEPRPEFRNAQGGQYGNVSKNEVAIEFPGAITLTCFRMNKPACPLCEMNDVLEFPEKWECVTCGHEWPREAQPDAPEAARVVKDAHGNVLADGDCVLLIKDLKLGGGSQVLKGGSKSKPIRLVDGDHEIDCKMDGMSIALKACFVKKA